MSASTKEISKTSEQLALTVSDLATGATVQADLVDNTNKQITEVIEGFDIISVEMSKSKELAENAINPLSKNSTEIRDILVVIKSN
ncbi:MAG: hypothetical protein ACOWWH_07635 [Eubacteriaceae bacterium]